MGWPRTTLFTIFIGIAHPHINAAELPPVIDLAVAPGLESTPTLRVYGAKRGDQLGYYGLPGMAFGDLNRDGVDDLIVGAYRANEVYVFYGAPQDRTVVLDLSAGQEETGVTRINYPDPGHDGFGRSVACGDFNGDGCDDLAIGMSPENHGHTGKAFIVFGGLDQPGTTVNLGSPEMTQLVTEINNSVRVTQTGTALSSGDINGDGLDDLLLSAPANWSTEFAKVFVIYGASGLPGTTIRLGRGPAPGETHIIDAGDDNVAGWSLSSGDVNADGFDDVTIGAPIGPRVGGQRVGSAYVVFGHPELRGTTVDLAADPAASGFTRFRANDQDLFLGQGVANADIDGDGYSDVLLASYLFSHVFYGDSLSQGTVVDVPTEVTDNSITQIVNLWDLSVQAMSVTGADVNGDGRDDIIAGFAGDPPDVSNRGRAGSVQVIWGRPELRGLTVNLVENESDINVRGANRGDWFGMSSLGAGDHDRDGFADFGAAGPWGDSPFIEQQDDESGYAALVFGAGSAMEATATVAFSPGVTARRGFGGRLSPVVRTWISFDRGANASGEASFSTATLTRSNASAESIGDGSLTDVADVLWHVTTDRLGWASAELTFKYVDSEVALMSEGALILHQSQSLDDPWSAIPHQKLDTRRNVVTADVSKLGHFALVEAAGPTGAATGQIIQYLLGLIPRRSIFDVNEDGTIDAADVVSNIRLIGATAPESDERHVP
jgi:hypothetical protein